MKKHYSINFLLTSGILLNSSIVFASDTTAQTKTSVNNDKTVAIQALTNMSEYLRSLDKFSVHAQLYTDKVMDNGHKIQFGKTAVIKANPPSSL